ncbi:unnamed protein product [Peniophora sp. CBMAI 1063]|nr:unnamed protein product [Peniophora sp. CBMAI 1063]
MSNVPPGVFHEAEPVHTHPTCEFCKKKSRCMGRDPSLKLSRCTGCGVTQYCSQECQLKDWKRRHKRDCKMWQSERDIAVSASGNPRAWNDLTQWLDFHHDTLANAALAHVITLVTSEKGHEQTHVAAIVLKYLNDASLPPQRRFRFLQFAFKPLDFSPNSSLAGLASEVPTIKGRANLVNRFFHIRTGIYNVQVDFGHKDWVQLPQTYIFSDAHLKAKPVQSLESVVAATLYTDFSRGRRHRFCCGHVQELSRCCCGGWTHEEIKDTEAQASEDVVQGPGLVGVALNWLVAWLKYLEVYIATQLFLEAKTRAERAKQLADERRAAASSSLPSDPTGIEPVKNHSSSTQDGTTRMRRPTPSSTGTVQNTDPIGTSTAIAGSTLNVIPSSSNQTSELHGLNPRDSEASELQSDGRTTTEPSAALPELARASNPHAESADNTTREHGSDLRVAQRRGQGNAVRPGASPANLGWLSFIALQGLFLCHHLGLVEPHTMEEARSRRTAQASIKEAEDVSVNQEGQHKPDTTSNTPRSDTRNEGDSAKSKDRSDATARTPSPNPLYAINEATDFESVFAALLEALAADMVASARPLPDSRSALAEAFREFDAGTQSEWMATGEHAEQRVTQSEPAITDTLRTDPEPDGTQEPETTINTSDTNRIQNDAGQTDGHPPRSASKKKKQKKQKKGKRQVGQDPASSVPPVNHTPSVTSPPVVIEELSEIALTRVEESITTAVETSGDDALGSDMASSQASSEAGDIDQCVEDTSRASRDDGRCIVEGSSLDIPADIEEDDQTTQWVPVMSKNEKRQAKRKTQAPIPDSTPLSISSPHNTDSVGVDERIATTTNNASIRDDVDWHQLTTQPAPGSSTTKPSDTLEAPQNVAAQDRGLTSTNTPDASDLTHSIAPPPVITILPTATPISRPSSPHATAAVWVRDPPPHIPTQARPSTKRPSKAGGGLRALAQKAPYARLAGIGGVSPIPDAPPGLSLPDHPSENARPEGGVSALVFNSILRESSTLREPWPSIASPTPTNQNPNPSSNPPKIAAPSSSSQQPKRKKWRYYTPKQPKPVTDKQIPGAPRASEPPRTENVNTSSTAYARIDDEAAAFVPDTAPGDAASTNRPPRAGRGRRRPPPKAPTVPTNTERDSAHVPDAPPGLKHPGYTFGSLQFGGGTHPSSPQAPHPSGIATEQPATPVHEPSSERLSESEQEEDEVSGSEYDGAESEERSEAQDQEPEPTWPTLLPSGSQGPMHESSAAPEQHAAQQPYVQGGDPPSNIYYQHGFPQQPYAANPPPPVFGAPWPQHHPYAIQASAGPYLYGAPPNPYAGPYGTMPAPYAQHLHAPQGPPMAQMPPHARAPVHQDPAQRLKAAAEALKTAARALEMGGNPHIYNEAMRRAHTALDEAHSRYGNKWSDLGLDELRRLR